jgi:hypothetical protein
MVEQKDRQIKKDAFEQIMSKVKTSLLKRVCFIKGQTDRQFKKDALEQMMSQVRTSLLQRVNPKKLLELTRPSAHILKTTTATTDNNDTDNTNI